MIFKPSVLEQWIATLPEHLQVLALNAIKEEHDRWERGDLTAEEKEGLKIAREMGEAARQTVDDAILRTLSKWKI